MAERADPAFEELARVLAGEKCRVWIGRPVNYRAAAQADRDLAGQAFIVIAEDCKRQTLPLLLHEAAHIRLGHVGAGISKLPPVQQAKVRTMPAAEMRALPTEGEAEALARRWENLLALHGGDPRCLPEVRARRFAAWAAQHQGVIRNG